MYFSLPSPLHFFFGSFLAYLPFVFPLSSPFLLLRGLVAPAQVLIHQHGPEETPGVYNGGHLIGFARGNDGGCLHRSVGALVDLVANGTGVATGFN